MIVISVHILDRRAYFRNSFNMPLRSPFSSPKTNSRKGKNEQRIVAKLRLVHHPNLFLLLASLATSLATSLPTSLTHSVESPSSSDASLAYGNSDSYGGSEFSRVPSTLDSNMYEEVGPHSMASTGTEGSDGPKIIER